MCSPSGEIAGYLLLPGPSTIGVTLLVSKSSTKIPSTSCTVAVNARRPERGSWLATVNELAATTGSILRRGAAIGGVFFAFVCVCSCAARVGDLAAIVGNDGIEAGTGLCSWSLAGMEL